MRAIVVGGPLDGSVRDPAPATRSFVWVDEKLRFYALPSKRLRALYRFDYAKQRVGVREVVYLYAGHTHAHCCESYWRLVDSPRCPICDERAALSQTM